MTSFNMLSKPCASPSPLYSEHGNEEGRCPGPDHHSLLDKVKSNLNFNFKTFSMNFFRKRRIYLVQIQKQTNISELRLTL
jgi:hypothetical protein